MRAVAVVVCAASVLLAASQFADYRGITVGGAAYEGIDELAPPPEVDRAPAGSAHAYLLLPAAAVALGALGLALRGRWRLGRAIAALGAATIAVSLAVDLPEGLEVGAAARDFEGAEAHLLGAFYAQLAAGVALLVGGALLARYLRAGTRGRRAPGPRPPRPASIEGARA